jgi:hypothetical protein
VYGESDAVRNDPAKNILGFDSVVSLKFGNFKTIRAAHYKSGAIYSSKEVVLAGRSHL